MRLTVIALCACLSSACLVTSVQPLYDDASLTQDDGWIGTWHADEPAATVVIERGEWKAYRVSCTLGKQSVALVAYLTRIGDEIFADITPEHGVEAVPLMVPVHAFARVRRSEKTLSVVPLGYDYFAAPLREKKAGRLEAALDARQNVLLTAPTEAVRAWLAANAKSAETFGDPITLTRDR